MNAKPFFAVVGALLTLTLTVSLTVAKDESALGVGARYHTKHSEFLELPFDDGDFSYGLAYEYHEQSGFWQLAVSYCPDPTGESVKDGVTNRIDYVITPQLSLVLKDNIWRGGLGALASYMKNDDTGDSDWTSLYWQFLLGISVPLGLLDLDVMASYPFDRWGNLSDFDFSDIDYVAWLKFTF